MAGLSFLEKAPEKAQISVRCTMERPICRPI
jgi:hypothetical protein